MTKNIRLAASALAIVTLSMACKKQDDATVASRQVELAPKAASQPQLADTGQGVASPTADVEAASVTPAPAAKSAPSPKPASTTPRRTAAAPSAAQASAPAPSYAPAAPVAPPAPTTGVVSGGTSFGMAVATRVCTNTNKVGDRVQGTLSTAISGSNGLYIPAGSPVTLRVSEVARGENGKEGIRLAFEPVSVTFNGQDYGVRGDAVAANIETVRAQSGGDQAKKVAIGAAVGALAGQLLGKKTKSTVIGAAVGAAAGGAVAIGSADYNGCLPEGGRVTVTTSGQVTIKLP